MTKEEAAQFLGVSTRAVERYTSQGRLSVRYEKGKTRPVAVYDEQEMRALKEEIDNPPSHRPTVARVESSASDEQSSQALITTKPEQAIAEFVAVLKKALQRQQSPAIAPVPTLSLADKLVLSLKEVSQLTGRSVARLRADCESGRLPAKKNEIARGWRVKRKNLDSYVEKL